MSHFLRGKHISVSIKSLIRSLYITFGVFVVLFIFFRLAGIFYSSHISNKQVRFFHAGINKDINYLKTQGDEVAKDENVINKIINKDRDGLIDLTKDEVFKRSIGLMGVTDKNGVILSRTLTSSRYGDNVFLTTPVGRVVSSGKSIESIEMTGFLDQIFLTTSRPVIYKGEMVGAVFANRLLDDTYAKDFRNKYLASGSEVVFYSKDYGVYGSSFGDQDIKKIVNSYFNTGSEWIKNGLSGEVISLDNGHIYLVENVVFPGLEKSPGGALVFVPRKDLSDFANFISATIVLAVFIFFATKHHISKLREERGWGYYIVLFVFSIPVFFISFLALNIQNLGVLRLKDIPYPLYNSTIHLDPEWGVYDINSEQKISVIVDTGDESINAVEFVLKYDKSKVTVSRLDTANSSCTYFLEKSFDNNKGEINFSCIILDPIISRKAMPMLSMFMVPKSIDGFNLSFDQDNTKVLANDGLGTNVLRMSQDGNYNVGDFNTDIFEHDNGGESKKSSFVVFSPSHPNQSRWYNSSVAKFVWIGEPGAVYKYTFDNLPDTVPSNENTIQNNKLDIPIPGNGIFYFHLQRVSGGPVAHYMVRSDMVPPVITSMDISSKKVFVGDVVRLSFSAIDSASGIQHNYYVDLGGHLFLPTGSILFIPFAEAGDHKVTLRVYDDAENYSERTEIIHVLEK